MSGTSELTETECGENMRAISHLAASHCVKPVLDFCFPPQECVVVVSPLNGSVLTVCLFLSLTDGCCPAYRTCGSQRVQRCTSCCSPDWVPEREGLV